MPDITVTINLSHARSFGDGKSESSAHLRIEDEVSGTCLFDGRLTPEQFYTLHTSSGIKVTGVSGHLDRVGKRMVVDSAKVPGYAIAGVAYDKASDAAQKWADEAAHRRGWDEASVSRRSGGHFQATFRSWLDKYEAGPVTDAVVPLVSDDGFNDAEMFEVVGEAKVVAAYSRRVEVPAMLRVGRFTAEERAEAAALWAAKWILSNDFTSSSPYVEDGIVTHYDFWK
jgi:hypothetical protein